MNFLHKVKLKKMKWWYSFFSEFESKLRVKGTFQALALICVFTFGLLCSFRAEANLSFNTSAYLSTIPDETISAEASQAFNEGWFLTVNNFRSRRGEALELFEFAQEEGHPYARIAMLYLQSQILEQCFPYAENQFDLIPFLVGDDPVGITLSALVIALSTDFLSKTPQNTERLIRALDRAILADYVPAYYVKGKLLLLLDQTEQGIALILTSAKKGNALAKHHMASLILHDMVNLPNQAAVEFLNSAIADGDLSSLQDLGFCYEKGFGVNRDLKKAMRLYKQSMKEGDAGSALALARLCLAQESPNYVDAFIALNFAYHNGKTEAANALGYLYMTGLGVRQDAKKGLDLMEEAAELGDMAALENLIACYTYGNGTELDTKKAAMYQEQLDLLRESQYVVQNSTRTQQFDTTGSNLSPFN